MNILEINNVVKYYGSQSNITKALDSVSFNVEKDEFVAIMGPSGSGKSTMLNVISTIDTVSSGSIVINGTNISGMDEDEQSAFRRENLGFIFQEYNLIDTLTVAENILLPLNLRHIKNSVCAEKLSRVSDAMSITDQLGKFPQTLSGGQRQRAACARALITDPSLILADEPTGALDSNNSRQLMGVFTDMNKTYNSTVLMVTHDASVGSYASRVLFLKDGAIVNELIKGQKSRAVMYQDILCALSVLGGDSDAI